MYARGWSVTTKVTTLSRDRKRAECLAGIATGRELGTTRSVPRIRATTKPEGAMCRDTATRVSRTWYIGRRVSVVTFGTFAVRLRSRLMRSPAGYDTHPKGMAQPFGVDFEKSDNGETIFMDVHADAVRKNDEVPDRPIRLTFERAGMRSGTPVWRLNSVVEPAPGIPSRALDRLPGTPKRNAPWPA